MIGSWLPSGENRDGAQSVGLESIFTSHRSGISPRSCTTSWASDGGVDARLAAQLLEADPQGDGAPVSDGVARDFEHFPDQIARDWRWCRHRRRCDDCIRAAGIRRADIPCPRRRRRCRSPPASRAARPAACHLSRSRCRPVHRARAQVAHEAQVGGEPRHPDGDSGAMRLVRFSVHAPPCHSSMPASAPCWCTASVIRACARISWSSQSEANGSGESSELGWIDTAPVHTTPQPPSALISRKLGAHVRQGVGHAARMRHLIETVGRSHRADAHRLEQDVEARIARHPRALQNQTSAAGNPDTREPELIQSLQVGDSGRSRARPGAAAPQAARVGPARLRLRRRGRSPSRA